MIQAYNYKDKIDNDGSKERKRERESERRGSNKDALLAKCISGESGPYRCVSVCAWLNQQMNPTKLCQTNYSKTLPIPANSEMESLAHSDSYLLLYHSFSVHISFHYLPFLSYVLRLLFSPLHFRHFSFSFSLLIILVIVFSSTRVFSTFSFHCPRFPTCPKPLRASFLYSAQPHIPRDIINIIHNIDIVFMEPDTI